MKQSIVVLTLMFYTSCIGQRLPINELLGANIQIVQKELQKYDFHISIDSGDARFIHHVYEESFNRDTVKIIISFTRENINIYTKALLTSSDSICKKYQNQLLLAGFKQVSKSGNKLDGEITYLDSKKRKVFLVYSPDFDKERNNYVFYFK